MNNRELERKTLILGAIIAVAFLILCVLFSFWKTRLVREELKNNPDKYYGEIVDYVIDHQEDFEDIFN